MTTADADAAASSLSQHLIEFRNVRKAFGEKVVYRGLNLFVDKGEALTIMGGSGVGKSVALKMLIGLLKADQGDIVFDNQRVNDMPIEVLAKLRQRVGMVFQGGALFDSITVGENVAYGLQEHFAFTMSKAQIAERVSWALGSVGLQCPGNALGDLGLAHGERKVLLKPVRHVLADGDRIEECAALEHHPDALSQLCEDFDGHVVHALIVEDDVALIGLEQTDQHLERDALPDARTAHDRERFALVHEEVQSTVYDLLAEGLPHVAKLDEVLRQR